MIVIMRDAIMPDCCNTCVCSEGYGCGITGTIMTAKEMESRPNSCPLEEVEPCKDAVSRADVLESFADLYDTFEDCSKGIINELHRKFEDLRTLPSAQPEIIHCRDCKHHHYESKDIPYCDRIDYGYGWKDDDFCSRAERRTDE